MSPEHASALDASVSTTATTLPRLTGVHVSLSTNPLILETRTAQPPPPGWERDAKAREMLGDSDTDSNWSSRPSSPQGTDRSLYPKHHLSGMQSKDHEVTLSQPVPAGSSANFTREVSPFGASPPGTYSATQLAALGSAPLRSVPPKHIHEKAHVPTQSQSQSQAPQREKKPSSPSAPNGLPATAPPPSTAKCVPQGSPPTTASSTNGSTTINGSAAIPIPIPAKNAKSTSRSPTDSTSPASRMSPPCKSPSTTRVSASKHVPGVAVNHTRVSPPVSREVPTGRPSWAETPAPPLSVHRRPSSTTGLSSSAQQANAGAALPNLQPSISRNSSKPRGAIPTTPDDTERKPGMLKRMTGGSSKPSNIPPPPPPSNATTDAELRRAVAALASTNLSTTETTPSQQSTTSSRRPSTFASHTSVPGQERLTAAALAHLEAPAAAAQLAREREQARQAGHPAPLASTSVAKGSAWDDAKSTASSTLRDMLMGGLSRRNSSTSTGSKQGKPPAPSTTGSLLKKYGVCEKAAIGRGATAVVRLAHKWDRSTEKLYAVKEFRKRRKNETEKEYVKKLTSEFCISSTLHHINVVETVDLVQDDAKHWCEVMEFCPGGDLYAAIKRGSMTTAESECYFKQTVNGIIYLHSMGVAHRDIKPENLLLDAQGRVKITDFGVSDVIKMCWDVHFSKSSGLCGSEPYIAPEQFEHKKYDARLVDVWAAAIVFYCLQMQELPWRVAKMCDPTFNEFVHTYHAAPDPGPLFHLTPKPARPLMKMMLCPDPAQRYGMDRVLKNKWFQSIEECGVEASHSHKHSVVLTVVS